MGKYESVLITGASSGIGAALAHACAHPGVRLYLSGRDQGRLDAVVLACRERGAHAQGTVLDVTDAAAVAEWVRAAAPLALVVANAGISAGSDGGAMETPAQVRAVFATNLDGMLNTVLPAIETMASQPRGTDGVRGRIAVVASIAAFLPAPGAPAYCASKAAADSFTVASASSAARLGVQLSSVCPGYIRTAMTAVNPFPMPGLMDAAQAARLILRGIAAGRRRIVFPWWMGAVARLLSLLPAAVSARLLDQARGKPPLQEHPGSPS